MTGIILTVAQAVGVFLLILIILPYLPGWVEV